MEENSFYQEMSPELQQVANSVQLIRNELKKVIIGQEKMIDLLITGTHRTRDLLGNLFFLGRHGR